MFRQLRGIEGAMSHRINGGSMRFIWYDETVFLNLERAFLIWGTMLAALGMLCPSPNETIPFMTGRVLLNSEFGIRVGAGQRKEEGAFHFGGV